MDLEQLDHTDGDDNTAGIQQYIYIGKKADIAHFPKPIVDDSSSTSGILENLVTITDNFIMKSGKSFQRVYVTLEAGGITCTLQGNMDGKSFKNQLDFSHPGNRAQVMGLAQYAKNGDLVFIVPEQDGTARVIGHDAYPAKMTACTVDTGKKTTDDKAAKFTFESVRKGPAPIFQGQILLTGGAVGSGLVDPDNNSYQDIVFLPGS